MTWEILGRLGQYDLPDKDGTLFLYEVERRSDRRQVEVVITEQAKMSDLPWIRPAVHTSGERALADVLEGIGEGEPPRRITVMWTRIETI
jgi:hypothetical protein